MEFLHLKKDDVVIYKGSNPYTLANDQMVKEAGEELMIRSDVTVQKKFFELKKQEDKKPVEKKLEEMNKEELIAFAEKKGIEVDNRKGEKKLLEEIKKNLK